MPHPRSAARTPALRPDVRGEMREPSFQARPVPRRAGQLKELAQLIRVKPDPVSVKTNVQFDVVALHDDERLSALGAKHLG